MKKSPVFQGFSPETMDFLWGIRFNNNREWFAAHKEQYLRTLYEPMQALAAELATSFDHVEGMQPHVSRIYRDMRMHPPTFYKDSLWLCFQRRVRGGVLENPCLFFEIKPEGVEYGLFLWRPKTAAMEQFRKHLAERPGEFLSLLSNTRAQTGLPVTAECYKRPKPAPVPELSELFAWKGSIGCTRVEAVGENLFSPEVGQRAEALFRQLRPLYDFLNRFF